MTDADFQSWLTSNGALRCILVEAAAYSGGAEVNRYMSNRGYVTSSTDAPANTVYEPCIAGGVSVAESMPLNGRASISWGDIEIYNTDGSRDSWLDDVWSGRAVTVYIGDVSWPRSDFRVVFSGVAQDVTARSNDRINILLRDRTQVLNTALSEATIQNLTLTTDTLKPLCFGEVHNITPLLIDAATLTYMVHDGQIEQIIEVRDNGIPVNVGVNLAAGTFSLSASPVGTITASVQGSKAGGTYRNTAGALIKHIAKTYGATPMTDADLDLVQLAAFEAANPQPVGLYLSSRANQLDVMQQLASSVGAQVVFTPTGKLQVQRLTLPLPSGATQVDVSDVDMMANTLAISSTPNLEPAVRLAYCRNYTVQGGLTTGLPPAHIELYGQEWLVVQVKNDTVADLWKLTTAPDEVATLLQTRTDTDAEAQRRLTLWGVRRQVMRFDAKGPSVVCALGSYLKLTHSRFGLSSGKTGQIVGKRTDWLSQKVTFEVLV